MAATHKITPIDFFGYDEGTSSFPEGVSWTVYTGAGEYFEEVRSGTNAVPNGFIFVYDLEPNPNSGMAAGGLLSVPVEIADVINYILVDLYDVAGGVTRHYQQEVINPSYYPEPESTDGIFGSFIDRFGVLYTAVNEGTGVQVSRFKSGTASRELLDSISNAKNPSYAYDKRRNTHLLSYTDRTLNDIRLVKSRDGGRTFS